jgi:hypothetical protein
VIDQPQQESPEQSDIAAPPIVRSKPKRTVRVWISYLLFAVSAALFVVVLVMYLQGRNDEKTPPPPTAQAGHNEMKDVMTALQNGGLDAEYGRSADRAIGVTEVAQSIVVDGETIYVFIYPDATQRQRDQDTLAGGGSLEIVNTRGTPVAENPPYIFGGSNVLVAVYSDDESLREKIQTAIEGLG